MKTAAKQVMVTDVSDLADKTVFLRVSFGALGNSRKVDGEEVLNPDLTSDRALLKTTKKLLDSAELSDILRADAEFKMYLKQKSVLQFRGILLLPCGMITDVNAKCKEYAEVTRPELVNKFLNVYSDLKQTAETRLGSLYNPTDYPTLAEVKSKFYFGFDYVSFGVPGHLKSIAPEIYQQQTDKLEQTLKEAGQEITLLLRQSVLDMVNHLKDKLTPEDGKLKRLRETAVTNLKEFINTFDLKNVTDDAALAEQINKLKAVMSDVNAEGLRHSDVFRDKVRNAMADISGTLGQLVEEKAARKFKDID